MSQPSDAQTLSHDAPDRASTWRIAVAGASGLVGGAALRQLAARPDFSSVYALVRQGGRTPAFPAPIQACPLDYARLGQAGAAGLPPMDLGLCALGTTIAVAGSQEAFRAVDVDAVLAFGRAARSAGARRLAMVSALGADLRSPVFYNRCKAEAELGLAELGFERLVIGRPSLLLGDRGALGQPVRTGELWAQRLTPAIGWLVPARWRPIKAEVVAAALLAALLAADGPRVHIIESDQLQRLGTGAG